MPFIGNQPALSYTSFAKQDFTTSATTSYTLDNSVANANELALFINFVRQEPTTAYSASGTTLTLTEATSSSDDMYCVYLGKAVQTVTPANNSVTGDMLSKPFNYDSGTLYLDDTNNRVGIGTSSPSTKNDVVGGVTIDSNANTVARFRASETSGSDAGIIIGSLNGNTPFIGTDGGNASSVPLTFRTENTERIRIDSSGSVFIARTSFSNSNPCKQFEVGAGTAISLKSGSGSTGTQYHHEFGNPNGGVGSITTNGSATQYNTSSDYRLKENVSYDFDATTRLKQLKPARFNFIADANTTVDGFLAHEVSSVVPEAISGEKDAVDENGNPEYQGIDQSKLVPLLVKTIQELEARITTLENK